jgi:hypothetical protein
LTSDKKIVDGRPRVDGFTDWRKSKVGSPLGIPETFGLVVAGEPIRRCRVVWRKLDQIGVEFAPNERQP